MNAYIEYRVIGCAGVGLIEMNWDSDHFGEFTRKNVLRYLENGGTDPLIQTFPVDGFSAVCGDVKIGWTWKLRP